MKVPSIILAALLLAIAPPAVAQKAQSEMKAFTDANRKMMDMMSAIKPVGDADKDFVMMMISHHKGAIDMAQIELQYGKDPVLLEMAQLIIKSQQEEIDKMKKWQQDNGM
jgi:uncharacterized protein (DUF305 family)